MSAVEIKRGISFEVMSKIDAGHALTGLAGITYKRLISIGGPGYGRPCWGFDGMLESQRLRLEFDDVTENYNGLQRATRRDVERIIDFAKRVEGKCLIHCEAGISRSSATAIVLCSVVLGTGHEEEAVGLVAEHGITADGGNRFSPNPWIVNLADEALGCNGRLVCALEVFRPSFNGSVW